MIYNWTNATFTIKRDNREFDLKPSGTTIFLPSCTEEVAVVDGSPIVQYTYVKPSAQTLPPFVEGVYYIVPSRVQELIPRPDFVSPDKTVSSGARYENGQIKTIRQFKLPDVIVQRGD